jgi:hypothetical protein
MTLLRATKGACAMFWIKVKSPRYEQSRRYDGMVGEVVGHWGPENSSHARAGYMVEFASGEIVSLTDEEVEIVSSQTRTQS